MSQWKKIIVSGSNAELNSITATGTVDFSNASVQGISSGEVNLTSVTDIIPDGSSLDANFNTGINLGASNKKFNDLFAVNTFFGGIHEINLGQEGLNKMQEGTVLVIGDNGLQPCKKEADPLVTAIVSKNQNYPIVLGAEPVLITGKIKAGDYIITSEIEGHGKAVNPRFVHSKKLFGKIIAQSMENGKGKSYTVKAMIRKL